MITESGRVVAMEADGIWVETASQSTCSRCAARKGCGQSLLAQVSGHRSHIKVAYNGHDPQGFQEGATITIGLHESAVLRGSLLVYCLPLFGLIVGATLGHSAGLPEAGVALLAAAGLIISSLGIHVFTRRYSNDERFQPVVVSSTTHTIKLP